MPAFHSDAFVLRTYPFREGDLIVSFFARDKGKMRGAARSARKPKSKFGSGLERLSLIRMHYSERENRDLVACTSCELLHSQFSLASEYGASLALDYMAEVSEQLLPAHEPHERFFRLLAVAIDHLHADPIANVWPAVTYFAFWAVRLTGILPSLQGLSAESQALALEMLQRPVADLDARPWTQGFGRDMRHFLNMHMELHIEKRFVTTPLLAAL